MKHYYKAYRFNYFAFRTFPGHAMPLSGILADPRSLRKQFRPYKKRRKNVPNENNFTLNVELHIDKLSRPPFSSISQGDEL